MVAREPSLDRFRIAQALREIAAFLRVSGGNPFRARAYEKGASALEGVADLDALVAERRLTDVPGLGPALAGVIVELHATGRSRLLEQLRAEHPPGVLELTEVVSLPRARLLHESLGVTSLDDLERACIEGRVRSVKGFGAKTEAKLLAAIEAYETRAEEHLLIDVVDTAETLRSFVAGCPDVERVEIAGGVRRFEETASELVLVAATRSPSKVSEWFLRCPLIVRREPATDHEVRVRLASAPPARLVLSSPGQFGTALVRATGPVEHVSELEARGRLEGATELEVYERLAVPFVPAEPREVPRALEQSWDDLVAIGDVRGMTHCHTRYSDGKATIEEMAAAAKAMGMEFVTITDHSPSAGYAGGVGPRRLEKQWREIAEAEQRVGIRILRGTESDIRADGSLDYEDSVLEKLDIIIASIHDRMKMDEDAMTKRLVACMKLPFFKVWGHALGRLVARRPPIACRVEEVLDAAAESGNVAIEVNGDPYRLDMEPRWLRAARQRGLPFVISTDAHSTSGLKVLRFGVGIARRGGVRRGEVLNARGVPEFVDAVRPVRGA